MARAESRRNFQGERPAPGVADEGPTLLWQKDELGDGYSTPAIANGRIFLINNQGLENEYVQALAVKDGEPALANASRQRRQTGPGAAVSGARSTPTVDGNLLYALGSDGDLVCVDAAKGKSAGGRISSPISAASPANGPTRSRRSSMAMCSSSRPAAKKRPCRAQQKERRSNLEVAIRVPEATRPVTRRPSSSTRPASSSTCSSSARDWWASTPRPARFLWRYDHTPTEAPPTSHASGRRWLHLHRHALHGRRRWSSSRPRATA